MVALRGAGTACSGTLLPRGTGAFDLDQAPLVADGRRALVAPGLTQVNPRAPAFPWSQMHASMLDLGHGLAGRPVICLDRKLPAVAEEGRQ